MSKGPMLRRQIRAALVTLLITIAGPCAWAGVVTIYDFDTLSDNEGLASQFDGLRIMGGTVLSSGVSLNESDFPPHSGSNVAVDSGPTLEIVFATPVNRVGGYFTYTADLSLQAFDANDQLVDVALSMFSANWASGGDVGSSPNEYLELAFAGIHRVVFGSSAQGFSFTLDDLTVESGARIPLPGTPALIAFGLTVLGLTRQRTAHRQ